VKENYLLLLCCLLFSCAEPDSVPEWMLGTWQTPRGEGAYTEVWSKSGSSGSGLEGKAIVTRSGDTVFREDLKIYFKDDRWHYAASADGKEPEVFIAGKGADIKDSLAFYSSENKSVQTIVYTNAAPGLTARIEGLVNGQWKVSTFDLKKID
jgi:hypothetical protein